MSQHLKLEVIVCIVLERYFSFQKRKMRDAYKNAVEEVRLEYFPEYHFDDFLGDMTRVKNLIKKDGTMAFVLENKRKGKSYLEISKLLDSGNEDEINSHKNLHSDSHSNDGIAFYHYLTSGCIPDCAHDTLSPYEASIVGVDSDPKDVFLKEIPKEFPRKITIMVKARRFKKKLREKFQLHFDFYDNPDVVIG